MSCCKSVKFHIPILKNIKFSTENGFTNVLNTNAKSNIFPHQPYNPQWQYSEC